LEVYNFRMSRNKTEYMKCNFRKRRRIFSLEVKVEDHIIAPVIHFKYLGSMVQNDGEIKAYVNYRIQTG
jgi:predicted metal-dependent peptidase